MASCPTSGGDFTRLRSLHPKYLDSKGLVALWREGLLAKKVLEGKTRATRIIQLMGFKTIPSP
ncbi:pyrimidine dimer DNA glycosylase/endonuclease V [Thermococcus stetteri]|uniref:pyrimidine dimer DNA glycosylase/endonuclease V n=1 Tax=Thermococcus stetteri TaxID=49900 RepID=UPI0037432866